MSVSRSSTRQVHTILGGEIRYETVELVLSAIPNFELKQKGRILHLFAEIYNAFVQEIQEALDEHQNNLDSSLGRTQTNASLVEPFAFESQIDTDTYTVDRSSKSTDEFLKPSIESDNISNETAVSSLAASNEQENEIKQSEMDLSHQQESSWTSVKDLIHVKREAITPPKTKRPYSKTSSKSKQKKLSSISSMRQMTLTQLFDPMDSSRSTTSSTPMKQEPETPGNDTTMFMPESLIGLAQPSESMFDNENEQNNISDLLAPMKENITFTVQSFKRKCISSPVINDPISEQITTDEDENIQNEALIESPYTGIESAELLYACPMCRNYWLGLPEDLRHKQGLKCRHRQRPVTHTPEHFWSLGIPNTQTCIQRGYGGVLPPDKPIERPRRPRRQYQKRLQEQQQNDDEEE
ncbi:unnamed protein product [Rotaria socialis]|uniref:Uncharacterized protein n=1 Tax=Rotaria socialis TaxID=392032 RepID=A0A818EHP6_9BILA|nr:unnamed protein product [Rotaria socialis]CAF4483005.1 unnamed protein product [Rotaria socialis]